MTERINQCKNPLVGRNIKRLRFENNMKSVEVITQLQLRGIDMNIGSYSKIENGRNNPTVDLLIALTDIFLCDFNSFFEQ